MIAVYVVLVLGISTIFWSLVGLLRLANEQYIQRVTLGPPLSGRVLRLLQRWQLANRIGSAFTASTRCWRQGRTAGSCSGGMAATVPRTQGSCRQMLRY